MNDISADAIKLRIQQYFIDSRMIAHHNADDGTIKFWNSDFSKISEMRISKENGHIELIIDQTKNIDGEKKVKSGRVTITGDFDQARIENELTQYFQKFVIGSKLTMSLSLG